MYADNLIRVVSATVGTITLVLGATVTGYKGTAALVNGRVYSYAIRDANGGAEQGFGTYTAAGTTLTRNVISSTNANALLSLSGSEEVMITPNFQDFMLDMVGGYGLPMSNGTLSVTAAGGALTVALKTLNGTDPTVADPVEFVFGTATGGFVKRRVTAATSIVVPSTATLGVPAAKAFRLYVSAFDDAGTVRMAIGRFVSETGTQNIFALNEGINSSTLIAAGSNTAGTIYSAGAAVTSKWMVIIGTIEFGAAGLTTAGTWITTNMGNVSLAGPGLVLPGSVVQRHSVLDTAITSLANNTSAAVNTGLSKAVTPKFAGNLYQLEVNGNMRDSAAGVIAIARVCKSSVAISGIPGMYASGDAAGMIGVASTMGFDFPNGGVTYNVTIAASAATGVASWNSITGDTTLTITELQA
jgi:hypothetical protein